ncbi:uncharacterized protein BXZ73DRAFT_98568 [Epithele typhae]|uniref:uncharacterized protein n=1 Tax=Epithele typhae TaxID=378194 RepID=UPI0020077C5C|nr:uncharacterized protein BXZ73DRAFT_98568 [Epithele typhae]KAH9940738.1 hypothetical protein BXZ73DRAFT_98568 [Epithele typhae]
MNVSLLPIDILFQLCAALDVNDILSLRQTCKSLCTVTRERCVWHQALISRFVRSGLPTPGLHETDLTSLPSAALEHLVVCAHRLHSNWTSPRPQATRRADIHPTHRAWPAIGARNLAAEFLAGHGGRYLLTLTLFDSSTESNNRRFSFECWDLAAPERPVLLAEFLVASILGYAVNTEPGYPHVLAVLRREDDRVMTTTYTLDFSRPGENPWFRRMNQFNSYRNTLGIHGKYYFATNPGQAVYMIDVETGRLRAEMQVPLVHNDPTIRLPEHQCINFEIFEDFVLTFRKQWICLYHIPAQDPASDPPKLLPIAEYKWRWRIDTIAVSPRRTSRPPGAPPTLDLLIRFDTWYPWPVNILHHFALSPNPSYTRATYAPADRATFPYLAAAPPADSSGPGQAGDRGQRVVCQVLARGAVAVPAGDELRGLTELGEDAGDDLVSPGHPAGDVERMFGASGGQQGAGVLMAQEEHERWSRVAMCEAEGLVAVGHVDGSVTVLWYAPPAPSVGEAVGGEVGEA